MQPARPVLLITHDDLLWQHWRTLDAGRWLPARGRSLADLERWSGQGRTLAVLDTGLPRLPAWTDPKWAGLLRGVRLVIASPKPHDEEGTQALAAGASGYCHGYAPVASLEQVLGVVDAGEIWMGRSLVQRLLRLVDERAAAAVPWKSDLLTIRETMVARRAARGESNADIARALGISERTVKAHLSSIFDKLGVSDRLQLALLMHGIASTA